MKQCKGTTKKGERCKIKVDESVKYCHYHISQSSKKKVLPVITKSPQFVRDFKKPAVINKPGFIYLYTLEHLISPIPEKQPWLRIHKFDATTSKIFNPKKQILVKIGCTTSTVSNRLKQWEFQCGHKLTLVNPYNTREVLDKMSLLINKFSKLSVTTPNYKNFKFDELGFKCERDVLKIEWKIHQILRELYGYGSVYCNGCSNVGGKYNIHVEWFLIPRREIDKVFKIIDKVIIEHNKL